MGSLPDVLYGGTASLSPADIALILRDVVEGLLFLHSTVPTAIVHGALKPQNIFIEESWRAKARAGSAAAPRSRPRAAAATAARAGKPAAGWSFACVGPFCQTLSDSPLSFVATRRLPSPARRSRGRTRRLRIRCIRRRRSGTGRCGHKPECVTSRFGCSAAACSPARLDDPHARPASLSSAEPPARYRFPPRGCPRGPARCFSRQPDSRPLPPVRSLPPQPATTESDVFCFGITAWETWTRTMPADLPAPTAKANADTAGLPMDHAGLTDDMRELLKECLSSDPSVRPRMDTVYDKIKHIFQKAPQTLPGDDEAKKADEKLLHRCRASGTAQPPLCRGNSPLSSSSLSPSTSTCAAFALNRHPRPPALCVPLAACCRPRLRRRSGRTAAWRLRTSRW